MVGWVYNHTISKEWKKKFFNRNKSTAWYIQIHVITMQKFELKRCNCKREKKIENIKCVMPKSMAISTNKHTHTIKTEIEIEMNELRKEERVKCKNQMNWIEPEPPWARRKEKSDNLWNILHRKFSLLFVNSNSCVTACTFFYYYYYYNWRQHWGQEKYIQQ